ncbi:hypothetical protein ACIHFD_21905 [Nonomuraea sp. NPDC051941]|uniref:hypothetical protein n=1 Tax=Nonomuraea sp. NPDC051941 TaxID=3364373 RepID=UPI0037CAACC4
MTRPAAVRRDHPTGRTVVIGHAAVRCGQPTQRTADRARRPAVTSPPIAPP